MLEAEIYNESKWERTPIEISYFLKINFFFSPRLLEIVAFDLGVDL